MNSLQENSFPYIPKEPIAPGETLLELLEERGIKQVELAKRMNRPLKLINEIIKGKTTITVDTAIQLEQVLGVPARVWNNLEANYQDIKARVKVEKVLRTEVKIAAEYPYKEMSNLGWVPATRDFVEKTRNLLTFFGVVSLHNTVEADHIRPILSTAFRISQKSKYSECAIAAWLRQGLIEAQSIVMQDFAPKKLKEALPILRSQTLESPAQFHPKIKEIFASCGIAFVVVPNLKGAPVNGASRWITPQKAIIQLSIRYAFSDIFWFTLFHELGHILLSGKKAFTIDIDKLSQRDGKETEADKFASETLINESMIRDFIGKAKFDNATVKNFAQQIGIHPGVVVGRLLHEKAIQYPDLYPLRLHSLRDRFCWKKEAQ